MPLTAPRQSSWQREHDQQCPAAVVSRLQRRLAYVLIDVQWLTGRACISFATSMTHPLDQQLHLLIRS